MMASFDAPDTDASCPVRFVTTQPTQALGMLNSRFVNEQAAVFATYLRERAGDKLEAQVTLALRRTFQREPTRAEVDRGLTLLSTFQQKHSLSPEAALKQFCVTAYNLERIRVPRLKTNMDHHAQHNFCGRTRREFLWQAGAGFTGTALAACWATMDFSPGRRSPPTA